MSSLALMRLLESAPRRYDAGMRIVTLGRVTAVHDAVAEVATPRPGAELLEIGCGTGAVTQRMVARGARVTALDQSPEMLDEARARIREGSVSWLERTASEIDALPARAFDTVVSAFAFSEMSRPERAYVLGASARRLRAGGRLVVADEVRPVVRWQRILAAVLRAPQAAIGWLVAGSVSQPIGDLRSELEGAGFVVRTERRWLLGSLALLVAEPSA